MNDFTDLEWTIQTAGAWFIIDFLSFLYIKNSENQYF